MRVLINKIEVTTSVVLPIKFDYKLDESLDGCVLQLDGSNIEKCFEPLDIVEIFYDDGSQERFCVGNDIVTSQILGERKFYKHEITLVEETKILEGYICDTITFRNPLGRSVNASVELTYFPNAVPYIRQIDGNTNPVNDVRNAINSKGSIEQFKSKIYEGDYIIIPSPYTYFKNIIGVNVDGVFNNNLSKKVDAVIYKDGTFIKNLFAFDNYTISSSELGNYKIEYIGASIYPTSVGKLELWDRCRVIIDYDIECIELPSNDSTIIRDAEKWTITNVVNSILNKCETLNSLEDTAFALDTAFAEKYQNVISPEFSITRNTLFEALKKVGSFIHSIPRLENGIIYFDDLGATGEEDIKQEYVLQNQTHSIDQYCDAIDSSVQSMVSINKSGGETITEPNTTEFRTSRVESGTMIMQDNQIIIKTDYPILQVNKLEVLYDGSTSASDVVDITSYVYEKADYELLSSFGTLKGLSKSLAIYFTRGSKNIYGAGFKSEETALPDAFKNFAIANIIKEVKGLSTAPTLSMEQLCFRINYSPEVDLRVKQHKQNLPRANHKRTLVYEQESNQVDNAFYGENLKGVVERYGNLEKQETYIFKSLNDIPNVGKIVGDFYISEVLTEIMADAIKCTVHYSKDFNRWSQYVGIKSNLRQYEISETMVYDRYCLYEDFCVIGGEPSALPENENQPLLTLDGLSNARQIIFGTGEKIGVNDARIGINEDSSGNLTKMLGLPVITYYLGNSVAFAFKMEDNYSAGTQNLNASGGGTEYSSGLRVQQGVNYGNAYGRFYSMKLNLSYAGDTVTTLNEARVKGNKLPIVDSLTPNSNNSQNLLFSTKNFSIIVNKGNADALHFTYQVNFVTDKDYIVIGSAMAKNFYSNIGGNTVRGYILPYRIGKFEKSIKVEDATLIYDFSILPITSIVVDNDKMMLKLPDATAIKSGKSLVFVDSVTNEILWAENRDIVVNDTITPASLSFRHKKRI